MSFLFGRSRQRTPQDLIRYVRDQISKLDSPVDRRRATEELTKSLSAVKLVLYGEGDTDPVPEQIAQLWQEMHTTDLLQLLTINLRRFEFEARKDVTSIFSILLRRQIVGRYPTLDYLCQREDVMVSLLRGYENQEIALNCGYCLRECIRHEPLANIVLQSPDFWKIFNYVENSNFDIASDAFSTLKELVARHKASVAEFLIQNYDEFFKKYGELLASTSYVIRRQSLKLLSEILLDRANFNIMTRFISSPDNLKLMMNFLRDRSRNIQFEAFHVFKVFVANPNKSAPVQHILEKNKEKLVVFLENFHNERREDEQFTDEKAFLLKQIEAL
ncbi:Calcium-binding protein 39 [Neolecta irregularis DAH-3]|uniref:Calcium-binding protein 39 n=1 Tax=Neolecta irregularis (strain DAH-3) TaxID=1198029 RepID=A0A1U7LLU9_NEOID|nr:Calcium-binding protein 39 [Neolecta irregularis DAH-3]|eukprot:OLL23619.1 Calcium-binding protein 39 [Neolecta irregularis DAH-3]